MDILTDAVAPNALHNSGACFDKPKCHPRTRIKIREIIMRWIVLGKDRDDQAGTEFMWLNGAAGCGKSAIAQSTVESCIERGVLLASFFFNRSDSTRNHAGSLVATLAYQLYCAFPETKVQTEILSAIKKDPLIFKKTLQQQFTTLIIQPLKTYFSRDQSTPHCVPFLIVIDGLDECTDRNAQKAILTGLANSLRLSNLYVPIFVASRPEHDIKLSFGSKSLKDIHTCLSLDLEDENDANSDIALYLFDRFAEIKDDFDNRTSGRKLAQDWPGDEVIKTLVWKSSRQFIYAATVIRYVESTRHRPDHRLDVVLNLRPVNGDHPFAELDELYAMILESALDIEKVLHVLSLLLMVENSDIRCLKIEKLLSFDKGEVETLFCDMGALVQVYNYTDQYNPKASGLCLRFLHALLGEYLLNATRSKQFHIDMDYETIKHLTHMLQYLALCCSGSFNPFDADSPILLFRNYIVCPDSEVDYLIDWHSTISLELRQAVFLFPLKEFLEPHTSTSAYPELLEYFVTPFLMLLEDMVLNDPTSSHIQDCHLEILRSALMQQVEQYFGDDRLASVLVLFYYVGSHHFVPILGHQGHYSHSTPFFLSPDFYKSDILSLSRIRIGKSLLFRDSIFHRYVRQLLHDPGQPSEYSALGPIMHERAALACFKELARKVPLLPSPSEKNTVIATIITSAEDDTHPELIFNESANGAQWQFKGPWNFKLEDEDLYFILLGYVIFLLPRCGWSDTLVAACKVYGTYIEYDQM
ncbi:hypothetical protein CPC08DRAFT_108612 [Agrocybe pediades]|nr:hypothetical protein CPC08DRAFT_108612 [Agrocybe pediades]